MADAAAADAGTTGETAATAAPSPATALPVLRKDMPREELATYLCGFRTLGGSLLFADAELDQLEHLSMKSLYDFSTSEAKWNNVAAMLFAGNRSVAAVFRCKVLDAKRVEAEEARYRNSKLGKHAAKEAWLREKRKSDVPGDREEEEEKPKKSKVDPFAAMMAKPVAGMESFIDTRRVEINWPRDKDTQKINFDNSGATMWKHYRDNEVRTPPAACRLPPATLHRTCCALLHVRLCATA